MSVEFSDRRRIGPQENRHTSTAMRDLHVDPRIPDEPYVAARRNTTAVERHIDRIACRFVAARIAGRDQALEIAASPAMPDLAPQQREIGSTSWREGESQ